MSRAAALRSGGSSPGRPVSQTIVYRVIDLIDGSEIKYVTMIDTDNSELERIDVDKNGNVILDVAVNGVSKCKLVREKRQFRLVDPRTNEEIASTENDNVE